MCSQTKKDNVLFKLSVLEGSTPPPTFTPIHHYPWSCMSFPCFVCNRVFLRSQDRTAHIRQKNDTVHREYVRDRAKTLSARFSETIQAASAPLQPPVFHSLSVKSNDVDLDDLPSSTDMNIDFEDLDLSDQEGSIVSSSEELVVEDAEIDNDVLAKTFGDAVSALDGLGLDDNEAKFDFLPAPGFEPDVTELEAGPGSTTAANRRERLGRVLDDDESQPHTWRWDHAAGKAYRQEESVYQRWKELFSGNEVHDQVGYRPFHSRLDWELAQWAVKNKIKQGSLNRLLRIPQVYLTTSSG